MTPEIAPASDATLPLWLVWTGDPLPQDAGDWPQACGFAAKAGQLCLLPDASGGLRGAIMGLGERAQAGRDRFHLARAHALPKGDWHLAGIPQGLDPDQLALGWLLGQYRFTRYKGAPVQGPRLVCPEADGPASLEADCPGTNGPVRALPLLTPPAGRSACLRKPIP